MYRWQHLLAHVNEHGGEIKTAEGHRVQHIPQGKDISLLCWLSTSCCSDLHEVLKYVTSERPIHKLGLVRHRLSSWVRLACTWETSTKCRGERREIGNGENGANLIVGYKQGHRGKLKVESEKKVWCASREKRRTKLRGFIARLLRTRVVLVLPRNFATSLETPPPPPPDRHMSG
jgi:hypothetical protein